MKYKGFFIRSGAWILSVTLLLSALPEMALAQEVGKALPASSQTAIVEMAPVTEAPPETLPAETKPLELRPIEVAPVKPTPAKPTPVKPIPAEPIETQAPETIPTEAPAEETLPQETVPQETEATDPEEETFPGTQFAGSRDKNSRFFPVYCQEEYPNERYGTGTVSNNGCSITALAIVATYMTGHQYYPDELARYFGHMAENNVDRLEIASEALKLSWYRARNFDHVKEALREGKIVIQLVGPNSKFTATQHFIVMTGMTEDNRIYVIDPTGANYERWDLRTGFEKGFTLTEMVAGYDGAWIYDPAAMPDDPYIYEEPDHGYIEPRYQDVLLSPEEVETLARLIWVEARGECMDGQQAVAEVVLNRLVSKDFPNRLGDVVYGKGQFATDKLPIFMQQAEPSQTQYVAIERALYGPYVLPMDVVFYARFALNSNIWGKIGGHTFCYRPGQK